jgi:hypothetical protein
MVHLQYTYSKEKENLWTATSQNKTVEQLNIYFNQGKTIDAKGALRQLQTKTTTTNLDCILISTINYQLLLKIWHTLKAMTAQVILMMNMSMSPITLTGTSPMSGIVVLIKVFSDTEDLLLRIEKAEEDLKENDDVKDCWRHC